MIQVSNHKLNKHPNFHVAKYSQADLFEWQPSDVGSFDSVFFGFWLSHVPEEQFTKFFEQVVKKSLKSGGKLFFIDSLSTLDSSKDRQVNANEVIEKRVLNDGSKHSIVKVRTNFSKSCKFFKIFLRFISIWTV